MNAYAFQNEVLSVFSYFAVEEICGNLIRGGAPGCPSRNDPRKRHWTVTFPKPAKPIHSNQSDTPKVSLPIIIAISIRGRKRKFMHQA